MSDFPAPAASRPFLPDGFDGGDAAQVAALFGALAARPLRGREDLERWLVDESDLQAHVAAAVARRYIAMTRHTDDVGARERYLAIERDVVPLAKRWGDALDRRLLADPALDELEPARYGVLLRRRRALAGIFRPENVELQRQEAELEAQQQAVVGGITVPFAGAEHPLPAMAVFQEEADRAVREAAWRAAQAARERVRPELLAIFDRLLALRAAMARRAGFESYTPYRFRQLARLDYGEELCERFAEAVAEAVVPAVIRLDARRRERLGVATLRPWDLAVDVSGRPRLRPFRGEAELLGIGTSLLGAVDPGFAAELRALQAEGLLDLMSRKGKAPGGYQYTLEDVRRPFVFANAVGTHDDVQTLLHESGHALHAILARDEPLLGLREAPIEMAETASMGMELLGLQHLEAVYAPADARTARARHLEGVLRLLPWIASIDSFQRWIYAHPGHSAEQRTARWLALRARFAPGVDFTGVEAALANQWLQQGHLFTHPLYYIEYGVAQLAALQLWQRYRSAPRATVAAYRSALALGGSRTLPELFAVADVALDVSAERVAALVADVENELAAGAP